MGLSVTLLLIILFLTFLLAVYHYSSRGRKHWRNKNVPYREPCPLVGNFGATLVMRRSYTETLQYFYKTFRDAKYVGLFFGRRPRLMLIELELVKSVLFTQFTSFSDRESAATDIQREPFLRNLANMKGAEWRAMRHVVSPTFSIAKMKSMFPLIVDCAQTLKVVLQEQSEDDVGVPNLMTRFTTDVIGSCAFGVDPGTLKDDNSPFLKMSQRMFKVTRLTMLKRYCRTFAPRLYRWLNLKSYDPDIEAFFTGIIRQVLTERRAGETRPDFLQLMLNVQKTETEFEMTDELIASNSFIFMLAGLETSATASAFCWYQLAKDQDLQERLRAEIAECIARHEGFNYEAVNAMKLVQCTIMETLRMHPSVPMTTRVCTAPCTLTGTDLQFKERDGVLIPMFCLHRDALLFPNPDRFDPERFKDDPNPPGYMPFGDGPRICVGSRFGQLMIAAQLVTILRAFSVEPCARTSPRIEYDPRSFMLKNKGGIWLKFKALPAHGKL